jgi:hypothetical protein
VKWVSMGFDEVVWFVVWEDFRMESGIRRGMLKGDLIGVLGGRVYVAMIFCVSWRWDRLSELRWRETVVPREIVLV